MTKQPEQIFKTPNTIGRPKGSKNKRTLIRQALAAQFLDGEAGFWAAVVEQAKGGDMQAVAMVADRLVPKLKPTSEPAKLSEALDGSPADVARAIMRLAGAGELSPDQAKELLSALADVCKIVEITDLEKRLTKLEALSHAK